VSGSSEHLPRELRQALPVGGLFGWPPAPGQAECVEMVINFGTRVKRGRPDTATSAVCPAGSAGTWS